MKILLFLPLLIFGLIDACNEQHESQTQQQQLSDTITIGYKSQYTNSAKDVSLRFDSVLEDSRCPEDATCVWAGNAKVRLIVDAENKKDTFTLNTIVNMSFANSFVTKNGYKIVLIDLLPHLNTRQNMHLPQSYRVEVSVRK